VLQQPSDTNLSGNEFYEWLRGFSDGELLFIISLNSKNGKLVSYSFSFTLFLYKDEAPLLKYIQYKLNLAKVRVYDHFCCI
jgi:hypothetical protein